MPASPLPVHEFHDLLYRGSLKKVIHAARTGTPMHELLPTNLGRPGRPDRLSPLALAWRWDWENKAAGCLEALSALIAAGANPNAPDTLDRFPLHLLVWGMGSRLPIAATQALLDAGANPLLTCIPTQGRSRMDVLTLCMIDALPGHAQTVLAHCPAAVRGTPLSQLGPPLEVLVRNAASWTPEAGLEMTRMLIGHGATPDQVPDRAFGSGPIAARARQWLVQAQSQLAREGLDQALPQAPPPAGPGPRL